MKLLKIMFLMWISAVCTGLSAQQVVGESRPGETVDITFTAAVKTIEAVMKKLTPVLELRYPELSRELEVTVTKDFVFGAKASDEAPVIQLPHFFVFQQWLMAEGIAHAESRPNIPLEVLDRYRVYLENRTKGITASERENASYKRFLDWANITRPTISEARRITGMTEIMLVDSVAFAIAHEIGHIVNRDRVPAPSRKIGRTQEYRADEFAFKLLESAGFSDLSGAFLQLPRFADEEFKFRRANPTEQHFHPRPECRLLRVIALGSAFKQLASPSDRRALLTRLKMTEREMNEAISQGKQDCEWEFDTIVQTAPTAPRCEELTSIAKKLAANARRLHTNKDIQRDRHMVASTPSLTMADANDCYLITDLLPEREFSYSCKWRFGTGDDVRVSQETTRVSEELGQCFATKFTKSEYAPRGKYTARVNIPTAGEITVNVEAKSATTGMEIRIKGKIR
jgi:hypothetical protein